MKPKINTIYAKILHTKLRFSKIPDNFLSFLPSVEMDFLIRRFFREQGIKYQYLRAKKTILVNNPDGEPFRLWFQFSDPDYIRVSTIPMSDWTFEFLAKDPADLFRKLVDKKLITVRQWRKIVPTQKYEKRMRQSGINYWRRIIKKASPDSRQV